MAHTPVPQHSASYNNQHWLLRGGLLVLWAVASFGVMYFARDWVFVLAGWPFSYWMAAQGAVLVFIAIAVVYALCMNAMERREATRANADD